MKIRLLVIFAIGMVGVVGTAFATHDPNQSLEHSIILPPDMKEKSFDEFMEWCTPYYGEKCMELEEKRIPIILSPLKQYKSGVPADEIQCKGNLVLLQKHNGSPACVKPKSINALIFRGWTDEKFRTLPIIDFQNPDRIFREVGYLGVMMLLPHIEENQTIAISLDGKSNMVLPIIQYYDIEILSEKTPTNESFSSIFGKITKPNLQKFFEENPMNLFVKRGVLLTSLGGYQDNTGTYGPFNQFLTDNESKIMGDVLNYYENKRINGESVHFSDFVKWPTGKINESFLQKPKPLDIVSIEDGRIKLHPVGTCAGIDIDRLTLDEISQRYPATYTTKSGKTYEIKFLNIDDDDLKEVPIIFELIRATHQIPFPSNGGITASKGLVEDPDWNDYREWYDQKKNEQFNLDEVRVSGFVYNDEYYSMRFSIC